MCFFKTPKEQKSVKWSDDTIFHITSSCSYISTQNSPAAVKSDRKQGRIDKRFDRLCYISVSSQTNYQLLFHFMDQIRYLFFHLVSGVSVYFLVFKQERDLFFCCMEDLNLIFCSELRSNEYKVLDLETGRRANGFVRLLRSTPRSLLLSALWLTWFAGESIAEKMMCSHIEMHARP